MSLSTGVIGDLHQDFVALGELDPESDIGFFAMSPASAEQVTQQIRTVMDRVWEYIALAFKGRAFTALGYPTWDAYVDARFGDFRLAVPREHRARAVVALAGVRMSVRAIAKLLGVGVGTVHRELARLSGVPNGTPEGDEAIGTVQGRDGKSYPRRRNSHDTCVMCGDCHQAGVDCPWDLFAQGIGPRPDEGDGSDGASRARSGGPTPPEVTIEEEEEEEEEEEVIRPHDPEETGSGGGECVDHVVLIEERLRRPADQVLLLADVLDESERLLRSHGHGASGPGLQGLRSLLTILGSCLDNCASTTRRLAAIVDDEADAT